MYDETLLYTPTQRLSVQDRILQALEILLPPAPDACVRFLHVEMLVQRCKGYHCFGGNNGGLDLEDVSRYKTMHNEGCEPSYLPFQESGFEL